MIIGAWARRRSLDFGPFFAYVALLFGFSTVVSAVHVPGGTFIHSAVALAPHAYILTLEGVAVAVAWIAARRPAWDRETATRIFTGATLAFAGVAALFGSLFVHAVWESSRDKFVAVADALDRAGASKTDRVMSIDASGTQYWTGRGGVVLVNDPIETIEQVARAYDIRWVVLDREDGVDAIAPIPGRSGEAGLVGRTGPRRRPAVASRRVPGRVGAVSRREAVVTALLIFAIALVARAYFAAQIVFPKPEDTAYYVGVARNLLEGRGLVSDALWSYQTPPLVFPRPAFEVWLPLPTFLAAIPMAIFGTTFAAAQVSSVLVGAVVPVLAWRLALDVAAERGLNVERTRWVGDRRRR